MAAFRPGVKLLRSSPFLRDWSFARTLRHVSTPTPARFVPLLLDNIEDVEAYHSGGLHPISIGDCFEQDRYKVLHKLGYGGSSTIWLARDQGGSDPGRLVALKALRADASSTHNPALTIPEILQTTSAPCPGVQTVNHHFFVTGPNGSHLFLVSPFAGPSILAMLDCPGRAAGSRRLRADLVRKVVKQVASTVDCMHRVGVVHGDITTANIMFSLKPHVLKWSDVVVYANLGDPITEKIRTRDGKPLPTCAPAELVAPIDIAGLTDPPFLQESVILADFGQSYVASSRPQNYIPATLPNYIPPEVRFKGRAGFEADVWMLGCAIFEIRAGFSLFSSFFDSDAEVLKQTVEILGRLPDPWWGELNRRMPWFKDDGELKSINDHASKTSIREQLLLVGTQDDEPFSYEGPMIEEPGTRLCEREAEILGDLLEKMLRYRPEDRIGLRDVIEHPWLEMTD